MQNYFRTLLAPVTKVVARYNTFLQANYPKIYDLQTAIVHGTKTTVLDGKEYLLATKSLATGRPLTYKETVIRWQYPRDMLKLAPVDIILALPFSTVLLLPLVYFFPAMFTRNFWTEEERRKFTTRQIRRRLSAVPNVIQHLDRNAKIPCWGTAAEYDLVRYAIEEAKIGRILSRKDLLALEPIFSRYPFSLDCLSLDYRSYLGWMNNVFPWRLEHFATHVANMDRLLVEGNKKLPLTEPEVRQATIIRCGNPNVDLKAQKEFLDLWTGSSTSLKGPAASLRVHFPVFLCYGHPINRECRS